MAGWTKHHWEPTFDAPTAAGRRAGAFRSYIPDRLVGRGLVVSAELGAKAAEVETAVRALSLRERVTSLEGLTRFLLRSEAIASSRIEGMQVSAQNVALAELAQTEQIDARTLNRTAQLVANNITILAKASAETARAVTLTVDHIDALHRALLPDESHHGVRAIQNWIGGNVWNPLDAEFVPPEPALVGDLMADLSTYANSAMHAPLIQAALLHAQFETIYPYTDGNGRVGRALIHTVLTRRGLTPYAVLPISLVLLTRSDEYVAGLTAFRHEGSEGGGQGIAGLETWLSVFLEATFLATEQVARFAAELENLRQTWTSKVAEHRTSRGIRSTPRADSATAKTLALLPEAPLLTAATLRRMLDVSDVAAGAALDELVGAGVLNRKRLDGRTYGFFARDVFELLTFAERRLASTRWDTRDAPPSRPAPARPQS